MQTKVIGRDTLNSDQGVVADRILALLDEWRVVMGLDRWEVTATFIPTIKPGETEDLDCLKTCADTTTEWYYQVFKMFFYRRALDTDETTEEELERIIVHELCHPIVQPMEKENCSDRENERIEFVVTNLERAFMNLKYGDRGK